MDKVKEWLSKIGRKGGQTKGKQKARGDSDYYRKLRRKRKADNQDPGHK